MSKKLLEIPTVRLSTVSSSDYNITTTWIPEGSGVKVQCGLDSMAIKVPGHVQQVFPVDPRSGIYYLHHFTYALEGLYECIRLNMTTGKRFVPCLWCLRVSLNSKTWFQFFQFCIICTR